MRSFNMMILAAAITFVVPFAAGIETASATDSIGRITIL
jgi:hypothetical protein